MDLPGNLVVALVIAVVVTLASITEHRRPATRRQIAHKEGRRVDLAVPPELEEALGARLGRRAQVGALGGLAVALVATAVFAAIGFTDGDQTPLLVVVLGYFFGHALGYGGVGWYESSRPVPAAGARVARASEPTVDDYVAPIERRGLWVSAGVALVVCLLPVAFDGTGDLDLGPVPWGLVAGGAAALVGVVGLVELASRAVLRQRQVATSQLELAWDDAVRARTLRDVVTAGLITSIYVPFGMLGFLGDRLEGGWPANPAVGVVTGVGGLLMGMLAVAVVWSLATQPHRWFRKRLWPVAVAGAVDRPVDPSLGPQADPQADAQPDPQPDPQADR